MIIALDVNAMGLGHQIVVLQRILDSQHGFPNLSNA
jgi:hypothetical protein